MLKRIKNIIRLVILKIINNKKINYLHNICKISICSINSIEIKKGIINFNGSATIMENSKIAVRNGGKICIGNNFFANRNFSCVCYNNILIKDNVSIGPNVAVYDHDHCFDENGKTNKGYKTGSIIIGNNVWIGAGAILLRDTIIEDNCVIGAGTIIKGHIPANSLVTSDRKLIVRKLTKK